MIVVTQRVPSSARPAATAGTTSSLGAPGENGRLPNATGPQPGNLTSSSTSMPARPRPRHAAAAGSPPSHGTRGAAPAGDPGATKLEQHPVAPAKRSRSTSASNRRAGQERVTQPRGEDELGDAPESKRRSTSTNPASATIRRKSSGAGRYATERGR